MRNNNVFFLTLCFIDNFNYFNQIFYLKGKGWRRCVLLHLFPIPQAVACEWAALQQHLLRITEERIHVNARRQLWCFEQHNRPSTDINWRGEKKQGRSRNSELTEASEKQRAGPHETGRLKDLSTSKTTFIFYVY